MIRKFTGALDCDRFGFVPIVLFFGSQCVGINQGSFRYAEPAAIEPAPDAVDFESCQLEINEAVTKMYQQAGSKYETQTFENVRLGTHNKIFKVCMTLEGTPVK